MRSAVFWVVYCYDENGGWLFLFLLFFLGSLFLYSWVGDIFFFLGNNYIIFYLNTAYS